jgi:hypothetical protein
MTGVWRLLGLGAHLQSQSVEEDEASEIICGKPREQLEKKVVVERYTYGKGQERQKKK